MLNPRSSSSVDVPDVALFQLTPYGGPRKKAKKASTPQDIPMAKAETPEPYVMPVPEQLTLELYVEREILPMLVDPIVGVSSPNRFEVPASSAAEAEGDENWSICTADGSVWSRGDVHYLQVQMLWASMYEFTISDNEREKWDVLKWIFKPVIRKYFEYGKPTVCWHENDEPFSFHNCCLAYGADEEVIREGVRRNVDPKVIEAVERVCTF